MPAKYRENIQSPIEPAYIYYDAEQSSFEEVASTVPNKDDPAMDCLTLRSFLIGLFFVFTLSIIHQVNDTTTYTIYIQPSLIILLVHGFSLFISLFKWQRLTIKEETIVLIMANVAWSLYTQYKFAIRELFLIAARERNRHAEIFYIVLAIQFLGFGLAGLLRRTLVWPSDRKWPKNFPYIALLRTLNEQKHSNLVNYDENKKNSLWKKIIHNYRYFFFSLFILQFIFSWLPNYFLYLASSLSLICLIVPKNYLVAQITGFYGLGFGSLTFNWAILSGLLDSPFVLPRWAVFNITVGFIIVTYIITPTVYFLNVWGCRDLPIGYHPYMILSLMDENNERWSALGITTTAITFATIPAAIVHLLLYHGKDIWKNLRTKNLKNKGNDLHCRLISVYPDTPDWWFIAISALASILISIICNVSGLLPGYFVPLASVIPWILVLPMGYILSSTGIIVQNKSVYYICLILADVIISHGSNIQNSRTIFRTIAYSSFCQTLYIVSNMKLAHYMKIAPRALFLVQAVSCLISTITVMIVAILRESQFKCTNPTIICNDQQEVLSAYDFTEVGVYGEQNLFAVNSRYKIFLWMLLVGFLLPIPFWLATFRWPQCRHIHIPLMLVVVAWMPLVPSGVYFTWCLLGIIFYTIFYKLYLRRHIYLFSIALDAGISLMLLLANAILHSRGITFVTWGKIGGVNNDGCPLTANGTTMTPIIRILN